MNYTAGRFKNEQPLTYITGKVSRGQYIQAYPPEYTSFQSANQNLGQDAIMLCLYIGERGYFSDIEFHFNIEILQKLAAKSLSGDGIAKKLHQMGFSHLLVNSCGFNFWLQKYCSHEKNVERVFRCLYYN